MGPVSWSWVKGLALHDSVREALKKAGVPFEEQIGLDGYRADFVFQTPDGKRHLLEAKEGHSGAQSMTRAAQMAQHLRRLPVDNAFVIVPTMDREQPERGVLSVAGLEHLLSDAPAKSVTGRPPRGTASSIETGLVFAAMPFAPKYDDVFFVAIRGAAKSAKCAAKRVDKDEYVGDVVERIAARIKSAHAVVVDLSEARPNVLYEMGYAHAAGKPVVPISSTPMNELPFDVRNLNVLGYTVGQSHALRPLLTKRLKAALKQKTA